jgi:CheY-like chemotaxis protein
MPSSQDSSAGSPTARPELGGLSALIVDDEPHVRMYLRLLLGTAGIKTVWEAANGDEAIVRYQENRPDVVLLDVNMPRCAGAETLDRLKAFDPDVAVIMVTSLNDMTVVNDFAQRGAYAYILKHLPKPRVQQMLIEALEQLLPPETE